MEGLAKAAFRREKCNLTVRVRGDELVVTVMRPLTASMVSNFAIPALMTAYLGWLVYGPSRYDPMGNSSGKVLDFVTFVALLAPVYWAVSTVIIQRLLRFRRYTFNSRLGAVVTDRPVLNWSLRQIEPVESFAHIGVWDVVVSDGTDSVRLDLDLVESDVRGLAGMVRSTMGISG